MNVHWLNSIPIDREIRARTDLPVLLTIIIIFFSHLHCQKGAGACFGSLDALRDHPCRRVEGGRGSFYFLCFLFFIIMGIRLEYACCFSAGPGSFVILSIGVISQMFVLGYYLLVTAVLASTEKLPFSPLLLSTFFFFSSHLLFKKHQRHSSLLLYHHYT